MFIRKKRGQSILEYAILMGIVIAVIIAIQIYVKRAVQGKFKASADQIGDQFTTAEEYSVETIRQTARQEQTLADLSPDDGSWTASEIQEGADWAADLGQYQKLGGDYKGAELSSTDYIDTAARDDDLATVGEHGAFDSGQISTRQLFEDD